MKRAIALAWLLSLVLAAPPAAAAEFGITGFAARALDAEGHQETRAGSHPDRLQIDFGLSSEGTSASELAIDLPPGFGGAGNPVPACSRALYEKGEECPAESQVGAVRLEFSGGGEVAMPVFQVEPRPGEIVAFGTAPGTEVTLGMELRPDDLGITFHTGNLPEAALAGGRIELWGVPADHQTGTSIERRPFLTLPTRCGPLPFALRARSREPGAAWVSTSTDAEAPLSGCLDLAFEPRLDLTLDNPRTDSPTGARIELSMPVHDDPDGLEGAQMESAAIELPDGLTISPGGAAGIGVCSDAQLGLGKSTPATCPASSRVGAVEIATALSSEPLVGDLYLGTQSPTERLRMFVVASGPGGIATKLVSAMRLDPVTGRLSAILDGLPQLPLSRLSMNINGGPGGLLASPLTCGSFPAVATLESQAGAAAESFTSVAIGAEADGSSCRRPSPFSPRLLTSGSSYVAGRPTTTAMTVLRRPGERLIRRFTIDFPKGLSPSLADVETCADAAAASGACPAGSKLGEAVVEAGSGFSPVALRGNVYIAGPYEGAPFSIVMALRAALGPFDLGTTAIRAALRVNPRNGRISVASGSLPALVEGLPIRIQAIGMSLDRSGALRNPTSCAPASFDASIEAADGATVAATSPYPIRDCGKLRLKPDFSIALTGRSQLHRNGKPGIRMRTRLRRGDTHLRALHMLFPAALKLDTASLGEICPQVDADDGLCTARARVGNVSARTSLLKRPLRGSIYIVQPEDDGLPSLGIELAAAGVRVDFKGTISTRRGRLVTNLIGLPDMPLSALELRLRGGEQGAFSLRTAPCGSDGRPLRAMFSVGGQNGARFKRSPRVRTSCPRKR